VNTTGTNPYIERHDIPAQVFAVFSGRDSEDPNVVAIVFDESVANAMVRAVNPDDCTNDLIFDGCVAPAVVDSHENLLVANDYEVDDHPKLAAALESIPRHTLGLRPRLAHPWVVLSWISCDGEEPHEIMAAADIDGVGVVAEWKRDANGWALVSCADTEGGGMDTLDDEDCVPNAPPFVTAGGAS
jgi:hypothetical protein